MATANPALNVNTFRGEAAVPHSGAMTVQGAAIKTCVLLAILTAVAAVTWGVVFPEGIRASADKAPVVNSTAMMAALLGGGIGGLVLCLIICFAPKSAPILSPLYAACEGAVLGAISGIYAQGVYPAIVLEAAMLTIGTLAVMLAIYASRLIVVTDKLRIGIIAATGAVCLVYLASFLMNLFGFHLPYIHNSGPISI